VRLIDMTRAFAVVSAEGASVEPHGILKVETADGELLYQHEPARSSQLVPDYVAAGITDLLQTAVATGTGRAAQIGRPVAGKTGTTSSNKDGYFVGFSSGITTGVWMGRDDNARVGGLQGGTAPARAFAAYMRYAVKDRPVVEFDTDLQLPEWQLEPDDEYMLGDPEDYYFIDEQGNLIEPGTSDSSRGDPFADDFDRTLDPARPRTPAVPAPRAPQQPPRGADGAPQAIGDDFLDEATGGRREPGPQQTPRPNN